MTACGPCVFAPICRKQDMRATHSGVVCRQKPVSLRPLQVPAVLLVCRNSTDTAYFQRLRPYPRVLLRRQNARFKVSAPLRALNFFGLGFEFCGKYLSVIPMQCMFHLECVLSRHANSALRLQGPSLCNTADVPQLPRRTTTRRQSALGSSCSASRRRPARAQPCAAYREAPPACAQILLLV